jgi:dTDP-4-amino-4,6-dideoxygalactose transaminase
MAGTGAFTGRRARAAAASPVAADSRPAVLGGTPVRREPFPGWPVTDAREEQALVEVIRSGEWYRVGARQVDRFESEYAKLTGSPYCLATANGTSALLTSLHALGVGPGDEVIVPPYTFVATVNVVLLLHALPVFVDSDVETSQIDAGKVEAAITERTRAVVPVHLGGAPADLDTILAAARRRGVPVVEDACQAHLAEWRGRKVGTYGKTGCFSFQASKNLNAGEGGAVLTADADLLEACYEFHNNSRGRTQRGASFSYRESGANLRMTEFQGALLLAQMTRLEEQARTRDRNGAYLTSLLAAIPGITPARTYDGCTRNAYHLYMFRYDASGFAGLPRAEFLKALRAEGVPASPGYSPLNKEPFLERTFAGRGYQRIYAKEQLAELRERNQCPENDRLCEQAVWLAQTMLLGPRGDMDQIAEAIRKIQTHAMRGAFS